MAISTQPARLCQVVKKNKDGTETEVNVHIMDVVHAIDLCQLLNFTRTGSMGHFYYTYNLVG